MHGVGDCPNSICVESHTTLVYNAQTNLMDAFTSATTDYSTASHVIISNALNFIVIVGAKSATGPCYVCCSAARR